MSNINLPPRVRNSKPEDKIFKFYYSVPGPRGELRTTYEWVTKDTMIRLTGIDPSEYYYSVDSMIAQSQLYR